MGPWGRRVQNVRTDKVSEVALNLISLSLSLSLSLSGGSSFLNLSTEHDVDTLLV